MNKLILPLFWLLFTSPAFSAGEATFTGRSGDGGIWSATVQTDKTDSWASSEGDPPLSPKKAKDLAILFMKNISLRHDMASWEISEISLQNFGRSPEHWIYVVTFQGNPRDLVWNGPVPIFTVPIRMSGTIPLKKK